MFTIRNTVIVALMQVGVIVGGVLASGLSHRHFVAIGMALPLPATLLYDWGVLWFFIPLIWLLLALGLLGRPEISNDARQLVFLLGIVLVISLSVFVRYADISPFLRFGLMTLTGE